MRVMLTGGTGFIGGHVTRALLDAGHEPVLLVRDPGKLARQCALFGIEPGRVRAVTGDILDRGSVDVALDGADACIHAAAFTSLTPEEMPKALDVNAPGSRVVLDAALDAGCDPVVSISSMSVIFPPTGDRLSANDPVHPGGAPYLASKADAELHARSLQDAGAPVVTLYPAGVTGPLDLGVNVTEGIFAQTLATEYLLVAESGGNLYIDVRDLAAAIMAMLVPGLGPRRYMAGGVFLTWSEYADVVDTVTGLVHTRVPSTRAELEQQIEPEAVEIMLGIVPPDDDELHRDTGISWRPITETLRDTIAWMIEQGRLDPKWAPALA
jgi:nucleoside-diphosphate-sugar epimerase